MKCRLLVLVGLVHLCVSPPVSAQSAEDDPFFAGLKGVDAVTVLADEVGDEAPACGLSRDLLRVAVVQAALDGRIKVSKDSGIILYVRPLTMFFRSRDECVTFVLVELFTGGSVVTRWSKSQLVPVKIQLHKSYRIRFSGVSSHSKMVRDAAYDAAREVVTAVRRANQ